MRHDMSKVIVERPRRGGRDGQHHAFRKAKKVSVYIDDDGQLDVADEFTGSSKFPIKPGRFGSGDYKTLNENLNPLYRYLNSQVGRVWDDVYSEVCEHINPSSTVQQHILVHLFQHVEVNTYLGDDGRAYAQRAYGSPRCVEDEYYYSRFPGLYVQPLTGILCRAKLVKRQRENFKTELEFKFISDQLGFVKEDDIWFRVTSEPITMKLYERLDAGRSTLLFRNYSVDRFGLCAPAMTKPNVLYRGIVLHKNNDLRNFQRHAMSKYGRAVWVTKKETANKRELRRYKLNPAGALKIVLVKDSS